MFRSIRARLVLWYTAIVVLIFILVAAIVSQNLYRTLSDALDQSLTSELQWVVQRVDRLAAPAANPQALRHDIFDHAAYHYLKEYIEIYDSSGRTFFRSANLENDTLKNYISYRPPGAFALMTLNNFRDHKIRIAIQQTSGGTVYIAVPMVSVTMPVNHILTMFAWLAPVIIALSITGGRYLANKSLRQVNRVIDAAKTITVDRLNERIPPQDVEDEIGRLISTFNEMIARLDSSFQQMRQFSADASHELRTPLAVMRAQLESALTNRVSSAEMLETIANCLDETMHMSILVEHLLLLARADVKADVIQKVPIDLAALVTDLFDESVILASHKSISVLLDRVDPATIIGDFQRLRQMALNLIDNAIKYSHAHGKIRLGLETQDGMAKLIVADTGIGIPEHEVPKIFDRFYRVDKARSKSSGGVGLGLSIVKWTAEAHGGRIAVSSTLNKGTTFTIFLPLAAKAEKVSEAI